MMLLFCSPLNAFENHNTEEIVDFDLSNPNEQVKTFYDGEKLITITMSKELSPLPKTIIPNGNFDRIFSYDNGLFYMSARFQGSCNPYVATLTNVTEGAFNSITAIFNRERYSWGRSPIYNSIAIGYYYVDYSLPVVGSTLTAYLRVAFNPGSSGCSVTTGINN